MIFIFQFIFNIIISYWQRFYLFIVVEYLYDKRVVVSNGNSKKKVLGSHYHFHVDCNIYYENKFHFIQHVLNKK